MDHASQVQAMNEYLKRNDEIRKRYGLSFEHSVKLGHAERLSLSDLRDLAMLQNLFYPIRFTSHRKIIGPVIVFFKQAFVKILDPFLRKRLARQFEINEFTWNMASLMRQQSLEIAGLVRRIEDLESRGSR